MPLVDIHLIEGVFDKSQKQAMIRKVTNAMVEIEGEAMRAVTWVRVHELPSGNWGIGGRPMTAADVKAMTAGDMKTMATADKAMTADMKALRSA